MLRQRIGRAALVLLDRRHRRGAREIAAGVDRFHRLTQPALPSRRIEGRADQRATDPVIDLHVRVPGDGIMLRRMRLVDEQAADDREPIALRELLHQRRADQATAQAGRRLREDQIVPVGVIPVAINDGVAAMVRRNVHERPIRPHQQRRREAETLQDRMHHPGAEHLVVHAHAGDAAAPTRVRPPAGGGDGLVLDAIGRTVTSLDDHPAADRPAVDHRVDVERLGCDEDDRFDRLGAPQALQRRLQDGLAGEGCAEVAAHTQAAALRINGDQRGDPRRCRSGL